MRKLVRFKEYKPMRKSKRLKDIEPKPLKPLTDFTTYSKGILGG
ncbi:MAG: hypothetical protein NTY91_00180 [Euryarchaeota archaeon]|nr:hypothetical protein [Euryarchaeota archaeon]